MTLPWLLSWATTACSDKENERGIDGRRVVVGSERDATETIVNEQLRFRLKLPGPEWKLMGEAEAARLHPMARAGAMSTAGVAGVVIARREVDASMEARSRRALLEIDLDDEEIELEESLQHRGVEARRFVVRGHTRGIALRYGGVVLGKGGMTYRLLAWGPIAATDGRGGAFKPFFDAFELSDGAVAPTPRVAPLTENRGASWRIVDGIYQSAVSGIRVQPAEAWHLVVGSELERLSPEAEVGLVREEPSITVLFFAERVAGAAEPLLPTLERDAMARLGAGADPERVPLTLFDKKLGAARVRAHGIETLHSAHVWGDACLQLSASYRLEDRDAAGAVLGLGLAGVGLMAEAERARLAKELERWTDRPSVVGATWAIHSGVYRDFDSGVVWTAPAGWSLAAGGRARSVNKEAALYLENRVLGLFGMLVVERAGRMDGQSYHRRVRDALSARVDLKAGPAAKASVGGLPGHASDGDALLRKTPLAYRIHTAVREDLALQLLAWGRAENVRTHAEDVARVARALTIEETLHAVERTTDVYRDRRLGFEVRLPSAWTFADRTPVELAPVGTLVRWEDRGRWVGVIAVAAADDRQEPAFVLALLEQLLRDEYRELARGSPETAMVTLAGRPARRVSWVATLQRLDAVLLYADGVAYALTVLDGDQRSLEQASNAFALLR